MLFYNLAGSDAAERMSNFKTNEKLQTTNTRLLIFCKSYGIDISHILHWNRPRSSVDLRKHDSIFSVMGSTYQVRE